MLGPASIHALVALVLIPLVGSVVAFLGHRRAVGWTVVTSVFGITVSTILSVVYLVQEGPQRYRVGGWGAPLGIDLYADGLSVIMVAMTTLVGALVSIYAIGYFRATGPAGDPGGSFWPLWLLLWAGMNALYLSGDLFNMYVSLELLGLSAVALVTLAGGAALMAGMRYLLVSLLGSLAFLLGVGVLYAGFGALDLLHLTEALTPGPIVAAALALMTLGMLLKTAVFPLHFWLPPAHANAHGPISAILSALVVKASFYVIVRLWLGLFPEVSTAAGAEALGVLGMGAIVWGSLQALRQDGLKMMIAYSTVAQLGYLFLAFPLSLHPDVGARAWQGAIYFGIGHACAKAAMFLAASSIKQVYGDDTIAGLKGIGLRMPMTLFAFGLAGVSLIGLPPSGGFIGKWILLSTSLQAGRYDIAFVILAGTLMAAAYVFPVISRALARTPELRPRLDMPFSMKWTPFALGLIGILLGLLAIEPLSLMEIGAPFEMLRRGVAP